MLGFLPVVLSSAMEDTSQCSLLVVGKASLCGVFSSAAASDFVCRFIDLNVLMVCHTGDVDVDVGVFL